MSTEILNTIRQLYIDPDSITDKATRINVTLLLNLIEQLAKENQELREEVQALTDEINRLKGEQGRPNIRPQKKGEDTSSEKERKRKNDSPNEPRTPKKDAIVAHREEVRRIKRDELPEDAVFKGYDTVIIQDIKLMPDNIAFKREVYYSPSEKRRFMATLPEGYDGEFGPGLKTLVLCLYHDSKMSQPAIFRLLHTIGIVISMATISRIITDDMDQFHAEKKAIVAAGMQSTSWQHMDDTGARVNGVNFVNHVLCNPYYTAYFTRKGKDRLTLLEIISQQPLTFLLNEQTIELLNDLGLSDKQQKRLQPFVSEQHLTRDEINQKLTELFPDPNKQQTNRQRILEAAALTAFHQQDMAPFLTLICDDAPQFKTLTEYLGLCWIHEGRHYKKLKPLLLLHRQSVELILEQFWNYYHELQSYKQAPTPAEAERLSALFDTLFSQTTGYTDLDNRLALTFAKKKELLLVLKFSQIPLHNNPAELAAREQTRRRDVSLQNKNEKGTEAKDTMMTVIATARKLCVNIYDYIYDRKSKTFKLPSLAFIIQQKSQEVLDSS
jgi:hypothetical protein